MKKEGKTKTRKKGEEKNDAKLTLCPDCKSSSIVTDDEHGEIICEKCGLVLEDKLCNLTAEYKTYDNEQRIKKERTGSPLRFSKQLKGLTTEIDRYDRDIRGQALPYERIAQMHRLRTWHQRTRLSEPGGRNLSIALGELDRMCSCLGITNNVKEECAKLYRKALSMKLIKGRSIEGSVAAVIYFVSREHHIPKTLKELSDAAGVDRRDIGRAYSFFCKKMELKTPSSDASDYVHRFAGNIGLSGEVEAKAIELLDRAKKTGETSGRSPISIAAAVIYFASGMSLKEISRGTKVGKTTLRSRCKELAGYLGLEMGED